MTAPILLTGGTGTLGRLVLRRLRAAGATVRVLSRQDHVAAEGIEYVTGDLTTGAGVDAAVAGVATIVHCAGSAKGDADKARNLVQAAQRAGDRPHLVYISVVGAEHNSFAYFTAKRAGEQIVADSGLPWTTLRATQFHDLILTMVRPMAKLPVIPVPAGFRFQPVDADDVAARLVELALGAPAGLVPDIGGPRVYGMTELVRSYLRATGRRRPVVAVPLPGKAARTYRTGVNLTPQHADGHRTWEDFLADRVVSGVR